MKKILIILVLLVLLMFNFSNKEYVYIPKESIRFRIIPNSNSIEDLYIKEKVLENVQSSISSLGNYNDINESRKAIRDNLDLINDTVESTLISNNSNLPYNVIYGLNYFPKKEYNEVVYNEGYYESLVVELGEAKGDNFWCVLFPPLCFLDVEETDKVEYKFAVSEIINKILGYKK